MNRGDPAARREGGGNADCVRWRARLETLWTRKLDEVIALSRACSERPAAGAAADLNRSAVAIRSISSQQSRLEVAYHDLAEIADAIARMDAGRYGQCARCLVTMPAGWLADQPQIAHCPDCSLDLVHWQPRGAIIAHPVMCRQPGLRRPAARTGQLTVPVS